MKLVGMLGEEGVEWKGYMFGETYVSVAGGDFPKTQDPALDQQVKKSKENA